MNSTLSDAELIRTAKHPGRDEAARLAALAALNDKYKMSDRQAGEPLPSIDENFGALKRSAFALAGWRAFFRFNTTPAIKEAAYKLAGNLAQRAWLEGRGEKGPVGFLDGCKLAETREP